MGRSDRKAVIVELVHTQGIRTQGELQALLKERGFEVAQATLSRDMADLDLVKDDKGVYTLAEVLHFRNVVSTQVRRCDRAMNQVVVRTRPGAAQGVAAVIDGAEIEGVLGSIAGDDTILVIAQDEEFAQQFLGSIEGLLQ